MFRTRGGEVVLSDFGVGRIANAGMDERMYAGAAAGSLVYLAPELLADPEHLTNTFASDMYVLL